MPIVHANLKGICKREEGIVAAVVVVIVVVSFSLCLTHPCGRGRRDSSVVQVFHAKPGRY